MKKRTHLVVALGLASLLVAGGLMASNMGFKLNYGLLGPGAASASGTSTIALPYHQQTNLAQASDLLADMGGTTVVASISKFVKSTDGLSAYTGLAGENFTLVPGEAYLVSVKLDTNYIIVGSHNPNMMYTFDGPGINGSASGTSLFSVPYHTTLTNAASLINEIDAQNAPGTVASVSKYVKSTDGLSAYTGLAGENFTLVPGEGYYVTVTSTATVTPSHY
jgi:hypothetical protein